MGKKNVSGWVEDEAQIGIAKAVKPIQGKKGSIAGLLNTFGVKLNAAHKEMLKSGKRLEDGQYELQISIVPRADAIEKQKTCADTQV